MFHQIRGATVNPQTPVVAIMATLNTKAGEAQFIAETLKRAQVVPYLVDLFDAVASGPGRGFNRIGIGDRSRIDVGGAE